MKLVLITLDLDKEIRVEMDASDFTMRGILCYNSKTLELVNE